MANRVACATKSATLAEVELMPLKVSVLGYIAASTQKESKRVGIRSKYLATVRSEAALRCSYVIFDSHKTLS